MCKGSQLSLKQRQILESLLNEGTKLCDIASELHRDPRGIAYEIKSHRQLFVRKNQRNKCGIQDKCKKVRLCSDCDSGLCKYCSHVHCDSICPDFCELPDCKSIRRFPLVCNGCDSIRSCHLPKLYYKAQIAHNEYRDNISLHKKGPKADEIKLKELDEIISEGVRKGHSIEVILHVHGLSIAPSTVYRYIDQNLLSVKNIDLKRKVRYKPRTTDKPKANPMEYDYLKGRTFEDFARFILENPSANLWQMDTLEGKKGGSAVLSLLFTKTNLQLYFKISAICIEEVSRIFDGIRKHLGNELFKETFGCILTDRGKENRDPISIETDPDSGEVLTRVFYCDARRSEQKGKCEKNHEHFREMIPKGRDMDRFGQKTIDHVSLQVNNYPRGSLNYQSPLSCTVNLLNKKVFELNNLRILPTKKITLKHLDK